jgi:hypothetical protein
MILRNLNELVVKNGRGGARLVQRVSCCRARRPACVDDLLNSIETAPLDGTEALKTTNYV